MLIYITSEGNADMAKKGLTLKAEDKKGMPA